MVSNSCGLRVFGGGDIVFPGLFELLEFRLVASERLVAFLKVGCVIGLHLGQRHFFGGVVSGSDLSVPLNAMCSDMCASPVF